MSDPAAAAELQALREQVEQFRLLCNKVPAALAYYERAGNDPSGTRSEEHTSELQSQ